MLTLVSKELEEVKGLYHHVRLVAFAKGPVCFKYGSRHRWRIALHAKPLSCLLWMNLWSNLGVVDTPPQQVIKTVLNHGNGEQESRKDETSVAGLWKGRIAVKVKDIISSASKLSSRRPAYTSARKGGDLSPAWYA
jgi:hypothetical protein